jgi:hypothetical protein
LIKKENWLEELNAFLARQSDKEFNYGNQDCCIFTARAVHAMTGEDVIEFLGLHTNYKSRADAFKMLKDSKYKTLLSALKKAFGQSIHPSSAQRGDLVYIKKTRAVGICAGEYSYFVAAKPAKGLTTKPTNAVDLAFKVGR